MSKGSFCAHRAAGGAPITTVPSDFFGHVAFLRTEPARAITYIIYISAPRFGDCHMSGHLFDWEHVTLCGLLHLWFAADSSLFANALVYCPPRALRASPRPGRVGGTSYSMTLVSGPPVPSSEAALSALQALLGHPWAPCAHRGGTSGAAAPHTA